MTKKKIGIIAGIILLVGIFLAFILTQIFMGGKIEQIKKDVEIIEKRQNIQFDEVNKLATYEWKKYQDEKFSFGFIHPQSIFVCENKKRLSNEEIKFLELYEGETCEFAERAKDPAGIFIKIKENKKNYTTAEEAFWGEAGTVDRSINDQLGYIKIGGLEAYGGEVKIKTQGTWVTYASGYFSVALKDNKLFIINDGTYGNVTGGKSLGNKPVIDRIIDSIYFNPLVQWK